MAEFALEVTPPLQQTVSPGGTVSFGFGPATPGRLDVILSATVVPLLGSRRRALVARARPGLKPPFDRSLDDLLVGDDPADPPDGSPFGPINQTAFRVEVFDARGRSLGAGDGPISLDVPKPRPGGGGLAPFAAARNTWRVQVTNNSVFEASVVVHVRFYGVRPIVSKPFELDFINDRFDALFNSVQPLRMRFENREREVDAAPLLDPPIPTTITNTWFVIDADESWQLAHPILRDLEFDLGGRVFNEVTQTTAGGITVRACVHDGCPAIRMRVVFEPNRGEVDLVNLVGLYSAGVRDLANLLYNLSFQDSPTSKIEKLAVDVFFVLRPGSYDRQATFQVIAQPAVEGPSPTVSIIARMIAQALFEVKLPQIFGDRLDTFAKTFAAWLLGDRDRELADGVEKLDIQYVGDAPPPQVVAPTTVSPTIVPINPGNLTKIDHIVVVMMENRSFDNMLGYLSLPTAGRGDILGSGRPDVNGLKVSESNPSGVLDAALRRIFPLSRAWQGDLPDPELRTRPTRFVPDPGHNYKSTLTQRGDCDIDLSFGSFGSFGKVHIDKNKGFVIDFANRLAGHPDIAMVRRVAGEVMGYHPAAHVPTYDFFAANYTICDNWFASHPGHTWPNRFVSLTGALARGPDGFPQVENPDPDTFDPLETLTIVDHLLRAGVSCNYFEHDFCMLRTFSHYTFDDTVIAPIDDPARGFFALARAGTLPDVSFVEPDLTGIDVGNDDHPPADVLDGQRFLRRIYDALATGPAAQWRSTLLLITYDEHGGFFDHVHPEVQQVFDPKTFDRANPANGPQFVPIALDPDTHEWVTHYGMRVPAFVVSPWVQQASVSHVEFDHTSILKTIIARFLANNPPDMGWRVALAEHVGPLLSRRRAQLQPPVAPVNAPLASPRVLLRRPDQPTIVGTADQDFRDFLRGFRDRVRS